MHINCKIYVNNIERGVELHFSQLHRKIYPCWVGRYYSYKIYIHELVVMQIYHFTVKKESHTIYSSIDDNIIFSEFDEVIEYIEKWVKRNCVDKRSGTAYAEI